MAAVAARIKVAKKQAILQTERDTRECARDFAGHESLAAHGRLVVEKDAVARVHPVGLAVVDGDPVRVELGYAIGRARMEGRRLGLLCFRDQPEHLGGRRLIEAGLVRELRMRIASSSRNVPIASEFAVCSGSSNETATWL